MKFSAGIICASLMMGSLDAAPIVYAEWVIADASTMVAPGLGSGHPIPVGANSGVESLALSIPPGELPMGVPGTYRISIRVRDQEEQWTTLSRTFQIASPLPALPESPVLDSVEAFVTGAGIPNDPGTGAGQALSMPLGAGGVSGSFSHHVPAGEFATLPPGTYRLGVRARSGDGYWTSTISRTFSIQGNTEPQFFYPRWRVRDPDGTILHSGSFTSTPLESLPQSFAARLPVGGGGVGNHTLEVALEDYIGTPSVLESRNFEVVGHADYWQSQHFTNPSDRANPAVSGPSADPNGDGIPNLLAYLLGIDPEGPTPPRLRVIGGPADGPRAEVILPGELPPGGILRILGGTELDSFPSLVELRAPMEISAAAGFQTALGSTYLLPGQVLQVAPPPAAAWEERGFFRLEGELQDHWPY